MSLFLTVDWPQIIIPSVAVSEEKEEKERCSWISGLFFLFLGLQVDVNDYLLPASRLHGFLLLLPTGDWRRFHRWLLKEHAEDSYDLTFTKTMNRKNSGIFIFLVSPEKKKEKELAESIRLTVLQPHVAGGERDEFACGWPTIIIAKEIHKIGGKLLGFHIFLLLVYQLVGKEKRHDVDQMSEFVSLLFLHLHLHGMCSNKKKRKESRICLSQSMSCGCKKERDEPWGRNCRRTLLTQLTFHMPCSHNLYLWHVVSHLEM